MPTADNSNASAQTTDQVPPAAPIAEDAIKAHPLYKDLEQKHSAARTGLDEKAIENKRLKADLARSKVLSGEDEKPEEQKPSEPAFVTKDELDRMRAKDQFLSEHKDEMSLLTDDGKKAFDDRLAKGYSIDDALKIALDTSGIKPSSGNARLQSISSPSAGADRSGSHHDVPQDLMAYYKTQFPNMEEGKLAEIIRGNMTKSPDRQPAW